MKLKSLIIYSTIIIASIASGTAWLSLTTQGLRTIITTANHVIPGTIRYSNLQGNLFDSFSIQNLSYQNSNVTLQVGDLQLDMQMWQLAKRSLYLNRIVANNIQINIHTAAQTTLPPVSKSKQRILKNKRLLKELALLHHLHIQQLLLTNLTIHNSGLNKPVIIKSILLSFTPNAKEGKDLKAHITSQFIHGDIQGTLNGHAKLSWQLNIPEVNNLLRNYYGQIKSRGSYAIHSKKVVAHNKLTIENLRTPYINSQKITSDINIDTNTHKNSNFTISAENINNSHLHIPEFNWHGVLHFKKHKLNSIATKIVPFTIHLPKQYQHSDLKVTGGNLNAQFTTKGLIISDKIGLANVNNPISIHISLPGYHELTVPKLKQKINGSANWQTSNLKFLSLIAPQISKAQGQLNLQLEVSGKLTNPKLVGTINLNKAACYIEKLNIHPKNISLHAQSNGKKVTAKFHAEAGSGTLDINGVSDLNKNNFPTSISIHGKNFLASNTFTTYLRINPDLTIKIERPKITINGSINIPKAYLRKPTDQNVATIPDDVEFVKTDAEHQKRNSLKLYTNIKLILGNDVRINMLGLKARLGGNLNIEDAPETTTKASGILTLHEGYYSIYGQELRVKQGSALHFTNSPIQNPNLNIRVYRYIKPSNQTTMGSAYLEGQGRTVGMQLSGKANDPHIELFSDPADISNTDIFSYIIVGQPTAKATSDKTKLLLQAASAFNLGGSGGEMRNVVGNLRKGLGLNELSLESDSAIDPETKKLTSNTSLVLGKYLAPHLYVSYSYGLLEALSTFRISYFLNKKWTVQTETSTQGNGVDILYHIEKK